MGGEGPVDRGIEQDVAARETARERVEHRTCRAVAGIPRHRERIGAGLGEEAPDIGGGKISPRHPARTFRERALGDGPRQCLDVGAVERPASEHHLDAVIGRRIVRARDHHPAVAPALVDGEVEHRRRAHADAEHIGPGGGKPLDQTGLEGRRGQAAVAPDADQRRSARAVAGPGDGGEAPADGSHVSRGQCLANDPPDVVRAEDRRIERVTRAHGAAAGRPTLT